MRSVRRILIGGVETGETSLSTPREEQQWLAEHKFHCDNFDRIIVGTIIGDFYQVTKVWTNYINID